MEAKTLLSPKELQKLKEEIDYNKTFSLELRKGIYGGHPYQDDGLGELKINNLKEKELIFNVALKFLDHDFGIQSICYEVDPKTNFITNLLTCFIDFNSQQDKESFIQAISFIKNQHLEEFISKIRTDKCTQVMINFPSLY